MFAEYLTRAMYSTGKNEHDPLAVLPWYVTKIVAIAAACALTAINAVSLRAGNAANNILTFIKLCAVSAIAVVGVCVFMGVGSWHTSGLLDDIWEGTDWEIRNWAIAFYSALWAYDGWYSLYLTAGTT